METPNNANFCIGDEIGFVALIQSVGDDTSIVNSARVSMNKQSDALSPNRVFQDPSYLAEEQSWRKEQEVKYNEAEKDKKLIKYLLEHNHGTPFEHNSLTFHVKCPIFIARQWMRHRISSFNEVSGRYVEMKDEFYIPQSFRKQSASNRQASVNEGLEPAFEEHSQVVYKKSMQDAFRHYQELLKAGVCREQARAVLPLGTYTEFYWTCNLRSFLHFVELRDHPGAQWEIQQYSKAMLEFVKNVFPVSIEVWSQLKAS